MSSFFLKAFKTRKDFVFILPYLLMLFNFIFKFFYIESRDICHDEPYTIFFASQPLSAIIKDIFVIEPHPPLYTILLSLWIKVFGFSAVAVRLLSLLFSSFTVFFIYKIGEKFFSRWLGVFASFIFMFSWIQVYVSLEARSYAFLTLGVAVSIYYFLSFVKDSENRAIYIGLIVSNILLVYSHYIAWVVIACQSLIVLMFINRLGRKAFVKYIKVMIWLVIAYAPLWWPIIKMTFFLHKTPGFLGSPSIAQYLEVLMRYTNRLYIAIIPALVYIIYLGFKKKLKFNIYMCSTILYTLLPYTVVFIISQKSPMFETKYLSFTVVGLSLTLGILFASVFKKRKSLMIVSIAVFSLYVYQTNIPPTWYNYKEASAAKWLDERRGDDSTKVLVYPEHICMNLLYHYEKMDYDGKDFKSLIKRFNDNNIHPIYSGGTIDFYLQRDNPKELFIFSTVPVDKGYLNSKEYNNYIKVDSAYYPKYHLAKFIRKEIVTQKK